MPSDQLRSTRAIKIRFEPFELNVFERSLMKAGEAVPLGGRAFDLLLTLIERSGETVGKNELIAQVWPDVTVEEGSLRVHMSALRKALGDGKMGGQRYIANAKGLGYRFVASVMRQAQENETRNTFARRSNLPAALGRMIDRDEEVLEIEALLRTERLITVLGTGGIGKTTVALAVGHAAFADFSEAVYFVDLSTVRDREQLFGAVASALGLAEQHAKPEDALHNVLVRRKGLIILDSCEHVIDETSALARSILRRCPEIGILATSRQPLQIIGERVFRLPPLACPPEQPILTAAQLLSYPAIQLFVERASARGTDFKLSDDDASAVTEICRKLDGVPLAIELAAMRAAIFGLKDTAARLGSRLDLLKFGRRTANPRHRTLRATLDWSHDHLSEVERLVLRRVAIFIGSFTLDAAVAIVEEEGMSQNDVAEAIESLVDKSMVEAGVDTHETSYRLLDTTRTYALEKLLHRGEHDAIAIRHANFLSKLLEENSVDLFEIQSSAPGPGVASHAISKRDHRDDFWIMAVNAGFRTGLVVPLLKDNEIIGLTTLVRKQVQPFTDKQISLFRDFAAQATIALESTRRERQYREMQSELAHANRVTTMGQLTASIIHEVSQPITAAVTYALSARRWLSADPPNFHEVDDALSLIVKEGNRAGEVVGRIRDLIKKAPPRKDRVEINGAIREVIELTYSEAVKNGVSVQTQFAETLPLIQGDRVQLQQVMLNLIINAIQAMSGLAAGVRELRITTENTESEGVRLAVRDSGPGLSSENFQRLFEPFYTTKPNGMGMGLSICRSIIEAHGGRLWATRCEPRGALFQFTIPAD